MQLPKGKNLYDILHLTKDQVENDESIVKRAYRRLALKYHPDKQGSTDSAKQVQEATQQFLLVGYAYSILSDSEKRTHYDLTGGSDDFDAFFSGNKDWTGYFKTQWQGVVNAETIDAHALEYQGSPKEESDVLHYYTIYKGNMNKILAHIPHSKAADVTRFMDWIQTAIENNVVDMFPAYTKTTSKADQNRRRKREQEESVWVETGASVKTKGKGKAKQQEDIFHHASDEIENSSAEEETDNDADIDDDEDVTLDSLNASQGQRDLKKGAAKAQSGTNKGKTEGHAPATDNIDEDSVSTNTGDHVSMERTTTEPSALTDNGSKGVKDNKKNNDNKGGKIGHKHRQMTITTRSMTRKQTKQTKTTTTTTTVDVDVDADAKTTTTVITKSKTLTKMDQKKRKRGGNQDDMDDSTTTKTKKTKKLGPNKGGKTNPSEKSHHDTQSRRRKSTKK